MFIRVHEVRANGAGSETLINMDNVNYTQKKSRDTYVLFKDKTYVFITENLDDIESMISPKSFVVK